jgi:hypothetical protein
VSAPSGIAYKAYEIEEFVDIFFFRRLGIVVARLARLAHLTPNAVSVLAGLVGAAGGVMLIDDALVPLGVALIVAHGVFDSADGQLARLTGQTSEWGRVLDGLAGYATHAAAYLAIAVRVVRDDGHWWAVAVAALAGVFTAIHAQLYDYHRTAYVSIVTKGRPPVPAAGGHGHGLLGLYEAVQRQLAGLHPDVERRIASHGSSVAESARASYRACFYPLIPLWNLFGDNVRRYAFIVLAWMHHLEWYFAFILVPMNLLLVVVWTLQRRADARFLRDQRLTAAASALSSAGR